MTELSQPADLTATVGDVVVDGAVVRCVSRRVDHRVRWQDVETRAQCDVKFGADQCESLVRVDGVGCGVVQSGGCSRMNPSIVKKTVVRRRSSAAECGAPSLVTSRASVPLLNAETASSAATEVPQTAANSSV